MGSGSACEGPGAGVGFFWCVLTLSHCYRHVRICTLLAVPINLFLFTNCYDA